MKGLNLFLAACFVVPTVGGAVADTVKTSTRTPSARTQNTTTSTTRNTPAPKAKPRTNIAPRTTSTTKTVTQRGTTSRTATQPVSMRENSVTARTAKKSGPITRLPTKVQNLLRSNRAGVTSRAATTPVTRDAVMQRDFGKCKTVFFDCMDEFCANKDTQLKRCACSTRSNEFKSTQKSLDNIEDKLLDFSQRLLKVNMDPADAAVINIESAGEKAYNETKDKTASKKALDEIAKKLNANFDSAETVNGLGAITWSLNTDSAFDAVDSLSGIPTTAKSGVSLRNAALPICREMASEVCDETDIALVENSYNMAIEQDCNTVKRAYETQTQAARTKVLESSALLDMTRLNNYQENNSDDILTCKSKMLDMLTNTNVCGENLTKCLDISGQYINPTTGEAFLSANLVHLSDLIVRPTGTDSWAKTPKNSPFVSYLNSKKKYIESATKNCQSIADTVWNNFMDDALAQIKLAQNSKLEEVRKSCTTLLSECIDGNKESLSDFDSRALSTFGVATDKTVNALCDNIKTSCAAVMEYTPDTAEVASDINWETGITEIQASETYNTIINTCREIGRNCIINSCKSITGNFGLCESIHGSVNRHSILNRRACWDDVLDCVTQASDTSIENIRAILPDYSVPSELYAAMYSISGTNETPTVYDICNDSTNLMYHPCYTDANSVDCYRCRIAEQIWGNCQKKADAIENNKILIPTENRSTLLSWFAKNTHTENEPDSCMVSICPAGKTEFTIGTSTQCYDPADILTCDYGDNGGIINHLCKETETISIAGNKNCCETGIKDSYHNCCANGGLASVENGNLSDPLDLIPTTINQMKLCTSDVNKELTLVATYTIPMSSSYYSTIFIFCEGSVGGTVGDNAQIMCSGKYIITQYYSARMRYNTKTCETTDGVTTCTDNYNINYFINANKAATPPTAYCTAIQGTTPTNTCEMTDTAWTTSCTTAPQHWYSSGYWIVDFNKANQ